MTTTPRIVNHNDFVAALTAATEALAAAHEYLRASSTRRNVSDHGHATDLAAARLLRDASQLINDAKKIADETVDITDHDD
ncbi:hypothetical protein [Mycobacteroides abscessus]|uniref:hypothetical protein n=1 Tax=Mycobacteroides abscessus TaxID=36809 RepID=UPI0009279EC5|nr:hypothetical protein [Mycobacteroides abscessus]SHV72542.1 Uncharacterised protein [Mycobacteroides abscessus subsp. abscessus]SHW31102.1 Uncharacterised protein [Mycobacteroides abscessus subsp. abscessus]SHW41256.1 Uncharacterised protein [Mycobacteroides abscessus subsp. abscessus]SHW66815.1 Uncharacterised protein [Mycobacteroides abscessus subsp. abscessus]SHX14540.1 Uncharacterised protein [Mycobacteroides abscessus subsp. abscessus]